MHAFGIKSLKKMPKLIQMNGHELERRHPPREFGNADGGRPKCY